MDKDKAYKLADALESGKYKQGLVSLRSQDGYCCLGVACEVAGLKGVYNSLSKNYCFGEESYGLLKPDIFKQVGIHTNLGNFNRPIKCKKKGIKLTNFNNLAKLNDAGFSFKFIAKIIRKHYKNII